METFLKSGILAEKAEDSLQTPDLAIELSKIIQHHEYLIGVIAEEKNTKHSIN